MEKDNVEQYTDRMMSRFDHLASLKMDYFEALDFLFVTGQGGKAKSSGERICAGIILSLYDSSQFKFRLDELGNLCEEWRLAANTVISGWRGEVTLQCYLELKFGKTVWTKFLSENEYRKIH